MNTSHTVFEKDTAVDTWIDNLTDSYESYESSRETSQSNQEIILTWMLQQNFPRITIPIFDGSPLLWVEFIIKFKDIVHNKSFLCNQQKVHYLHQHVIGEARRAIQAYLNDRRGYIFPLKRLKCVFGQKSKVAQAHLSKVTRGKWITNDGDKGLLNYYYTINGCLIDFCDMSQKSTVKTFCAKLPDGFLPNFRADGVNIV